MNIAHNLKRVSKIFPDKVAITFEGRSYTYFQLNEESEKLTAALKKLGVEKGDRVAIFLPNIPEFAFAYYAIQQCGAIAVSINCNLKERELSYILSDCKPKVLFTTGEIGEHIPESSKKEMEVIIAEGEADFGHPLSSLTDSIRPVSWVEEMQSHEPAAILYTSGTTGFPKGATLSHSNVISNVNAFDYNCGIKPDDQVILFLPLFHCFGQNAILNSCLNVGATVVLHRGFHPEKITDSIVKDKINKLFAVPTIFIALIHSLTPEQMKGITYTFSAASILPLEISKRWLEKFNQPIYEGYGLTETSPFASYNHLLQYKAGSIGMAIENVEMKVVDAEDKELPVGELGEIIIRGPNVMLGYWNNPEDTAKVIKEGWFYSGDIGKVDTDGYFYIVDRVKDLIIIGGINVYPAEIENVIYLHPAVDVCAAYGLDETSMGEEVCLDIVLKKEAACSQEDILELCSKNLASYKTPSQINFVETIPKNPTGKILKRVLRDRASQNLKEAETAVAKKPLPSIVESQTWLSDWLNKNKSGDEVEVKNDTSFFDLGLDSILAVSLANDLSAWLGRKVGAIALWNHSTPEQLCEYISKLDESKSVSPSPEKTQKPRPKKDSQNESLKDLSSEEMAKLLEEELEDDLS